jgi:DUF1680 family protein
MPERVEPGGFANIQRTWRTGDHVELDLPLTKRVEPIRLATPEHRRIAEWSARIVCHHGQAKKVTSQQLLAAKRIGSTELASRNHGCTFDDAAGYGF